MPDRNPPSCAAVRSMAATTTTTTINTMTATMATTTTCHHHHAGTKTSTRIGSPTAALVPTPQVAEQLPQGAHSSQTSSSKPVRVGLSSPKHNSSCFECSQPSSTINRARVRVTVATFFVVVVAGSLGFCSNI